MIYPSGRAIALAGAGAFPALLAALLVPAWWHLALLWIALLLGFMAVDALAGAGPKAVKAIVGAPAMVGVGAGVPVRIAVTGVGGRVEARLGHDALLSDTGTLAPKLMLSGDGGDDGGAVHHLVAARRGLSRLGPLWLRWRGPFGLVWKQRVIDPQTQVAIQPDMDGVREDAMRLLRRDAMIGERVEPCIGQGREFEALTDYRRGMERRMIDWKRSARHSRLLAKEYRAETANSLVLAIDSGRLMCEPVAGLPRIDRAISATLLTAFVALKAGDGVRLFSFDSHPHVASGAVRGLAGFAQLQRLAAQIDYSAQETNFTLGLTSLDARLDRRSLVIIFTDFVDPASAELMLRTAGRLTSKHVVLFLMMRDEELESLVDTVPTGSEDVARAVAAGILLRERKLVIERLRLAGAEVLEADWRNMGPQLVTRYLDIVKAQRL